MRAGAQEVLQQLAAFWTPERLGAVGSALVESYLPLTVRRIGVHWQGVGGAQGGSSTPDAAD